MTGTLQLYSTLTTVLGGHQNWLDVRHLKTLAWMMVGLIESGLISLTEWVPYVHSRATYAQSSVRRFRGWLDIDRIEEHKLYGPLVQQALAEWGQHKLYLALDTSMLWGQYCLGPAHMTLSTSGKQNPGVSKLFWPRFLGQAFKKQAETRHFRVFCPFSYQIGTEMIFPHSKSSFFRGIQVAGLYFPKCVTFLVSRSTPAHIETAKEILIARRQTHLDQLADKLQQPRVRWVIEPMMASPPSAVLHRTTWTT